LTNRRYKRKERQFRVALFFSAAALAGAFGGILAYGIAHMDGVAGLEGWNWMYETVDAKLWWDMLIRYSFILEGIATVLVGCSAYLFISNYPATATFLKPAERSFINKRLAADSDATENEGFTWTNVKAALTDPACWLYVNYGQRESSSSHFSAHPP
jgi:MFS family permease